ncbi:hypothetical protein [Neolewinella agarilytica]|uniref:Uncharacterized protein n=1 Tax=Neolewinella agarilytica TaxID=478744 RepID=A0A1H9GN41_9BACT|nr:hypothetical protein [Neolewinella agarilytica]SEQ51414.1 hypothetical protein SAMN05444359_11128 [Neolewinella agarilytica]
MANSKTLRIDISEGGNGDMWMRMASFYAMAKICGEIKFELFVPGFMQNLANYTFNDRLTFLEEKDNCDIRFTSLGLKHMATGIRKGKSYIAPYHRSVITDKGSRTVKDQLNIALHNVGQVLGKIHLPPWEVINDYQGYMDIIGLKVLRGVTYEAYLHQMESDYHEHVEKLRAAAMPTSPELTFPDDIQKSTVVFPNGTSRQFIPVWWAKKHLPEAYYAFFIKDTYATEFQKANLKVVYYYSEPGDIVALSHRSNWTISTDSFSSHLLQYSTERCTITTTEVLASRIITPVYRGKVVDAVAPCHPCLKMERKAHPTCMAGYADCLNWKSEVYSQNILQSIPG